MTNKHLKALALVLLCATALSSTLHASDNPCEPYRTNTEDTYRSFNNAQFIPEAQKIFEACKNPGVKDLSVPRTLINALKQRNFKSSEVKLWKDWYTNLKKSEWDEIKALDPIKEYLTIQLKIPSDDIDPPVELKTPINKTVLQKPATNKVPDINNNFTQDWSDSEEDAAVDNTPVQTPKSQGQTTNNDFVAPPKPSTSGLNVVDQAKFDNQWTDYIAKLKNGTWPQGKAAPIPSSSALPGMFGGPENPAKKALNPAVVSNRPRFVAPKGLSLSIPQAAALRGGFNEAWDAWNDAGRQGDEPTIASVAQAQGLTLSAGTSPAPNNTNTGQQPGTKPTSLGTGKTKKPLYSSPPPKPQPRPMGQGVNVPILPTPTNNTPNNPSPKVGASPTLIVSAPRGTPTTIDLTARSSNGKRLYSTTIGTNLPKPLSGLTNQELLDEITNANANGTSPDVVNILKKTVEKRDVPTPGNTNPTLVQNAWLKAHITGVPNNTATTNNTNAQLPPPINATGANPQLPPPPTIPQQPAGQATGANPQLPPPPTIPQQPGGQATGANRQLPPPLNATSSQPAIQQTPTQTPDQIRQEIAVLGKSLQTKANIQKIKLLENKLLSLGGTQQNLPANTAQINLPTTASSSQPSKPATVSTSQPAIQSAPNQQTSTQTPDQIRQEIAVLGQGLQTRATKQKIDALMAKLPK